jgi:predicted nucleic acid-binding protein
VRGIADTGFLVAFANRNDHYHRWAASVAAQITEPLLTCEAVLAESAFHLRNVAITMQMLDEGLVRLAFTLHEHLPQIAALAKRYGDRRPDLADLCLIRMSELHPRHSVVTIDRDDFRVYRRNKREAIPLLCPPQR